MAIQSILIDKNYFTLKIAYAWIIKHGYKHYKIDITKNKYRFRQLEPDPSKRYYTIKLTDGVEAICFKG